MAHSLFPIALDPTPEGKALADRIDLAILNLQRVRDRILAPVNGLRGPERIAAARALNAYGSPLIIALETIAKVGPDAA